MAYFVRNLLWSTNIFFTTSIKLKKINCKGNISSKTNLLLFYEFTHIICIYKLSVHFIANINLSRKKRHIPDFTSSVYLKERYFLYSFLQYFVMIMSVPRYANVHTKILIKQQPLVYKFTMAMELAKINLNRVLILKIIDFFYEGSWMFVIQKYINVP